MSPLIAVTLIILSTITLTVVKRKIKVRRRIKANDKIISDIIDKIERYEREKNNNR